MLLGEPPRTQYDLNFTLAGVPVRVHPLFWLVGVFLGANGTGVDMMIFVVCLFVSILVHEMGHAIAMRRYGLKPRIVLHVLGGLAIADSSPYAIPGMEKERGPKEQIIISFAGPAAGFVLALLVAAAVKMAGGSFEHKFILVWAYLPPELDPRSLWGHTASFLLYINIAWGLMNLLPVYPLDGGQISRELFTMKDPWQGVVRSLWVSIFTAAGMVIVAITMGSFFIGLMFGSLAYMSYMTLQNFTGRGGSYGGRPY